MERTLISDLGSTLIVIGLSVSGASGQTETLLESFEDGVDSVLFVGGNPRSEEDLEISQYTKNGGADTRVTHGEKALRLRLKTAYQWGRDAELTFSEEAGNLIKRAWASKEKARYLIRYDVEFPTENVNWGNFIVHLSGWDYAQLTQSGVANRSMSIPLDLVTADLAAEDRITFAIINQYGVPDDTESLDVFLDNIRLVDTYAPGAIPEITLLNGFETQEDVDELLPVSDRYEARFYRKTGADDLAVTEGEGSLECTFSSSGAWMRDFAIPFRGTIMESVALIPQEDRTRYTLRIDVIFEERGDNWSGNWQNFDVHQAGGGAQQFAMHRAGDDQHVRSFSAPLDQFTLEPGDPDNPEDVNPGISIINQGAWTDAGMTMHIDNIRLIDTGKAPLAIEDLVLNGHGGVSVSWRSSPSQAYGLQISPNLIDWTELVTGVVGDAVSPKTSYVDAGAALGGSRFYRVFVTGPAPPLKEGFENGLGDWTVSVKEPDEGSTRWEVGAPGNGPAAAHGGRNLAGTGIAADYTGRTHVSLLSPEVDLSAFLSNPTLSLAYYLDIDADAAVRVNVLDAAGLVLEEGTEDNGLFFSGPQKTDDWTELSVEIPVRGQKVMLEFEFVDAGREATNGAGFFIDDLFIAAAEP